MIFPVLLKPETLMDQEADFSTDMRMYAYKTVITFPIARHARVLVKVHVKDSDGDRRGY